MFKNVASQKITFLVIDTANNVPKTGDAANLTAYVAKDDGAVTILGDTSATELDATNAPGLYSFDLTQAETNADKLVFSGKSSTADIRVVPVLIYTLPSGIGDLAIANNATAANVTRYGGSAGTFSGGRPEVNTSHAAGTAWNSGAISASTLATDTITAAKIATEAITSAKFAADALTSDVISSDFSREIRSVASGTSDSGTTTTMVDAARTEADTDYWVGSLIVFTSGNIAGQARYITAFNPATDTITFTPATTQAVATQSYEIWPSGDYLRPTTSGRTLDVSAGGEAGVDWANVGSQSTSVNLSATTVNLTNTVTTYTGNTPQTGDAFARLGAPAGASVSADILVLDNLVDDLESRLGTPSNLGSGATVAANLVDIEGQTDDIGVAGAGLTAIGDTRLANLDAAISSRMATYTQPTGFLAATFPSTVASTTNITAGTITTVTNLTNAPTSGDLTATMKASVNAEVDTALADIHLDHLIASADPGGVVANSSFLAKLVSDSLTPDFTDYDNQTMSLGAIGGYTQSLDTVDLPNVLSRLPAALVSGRMDASVGAMAANTLTASALAADAGAEIADAVWDEAIAGHLGAGSTGEALSAAGSAGDPWTTSLPGGYGAGTAGKIVGELKYLITTAVTAGHVVDNSIIAKIVSKNATSSWDSDFDPATDALNALSDAIDLKATQTSVNTIDDFLDTEIAAIKAKTDNLPTDPADQSAVEAAILAAWTTALTESYAADGATFTPAQALYMLWAAVAEFAVAGTTITAKKLDGSTAAMTFTLDSATTPTSRTRAS